MKGASTIRKGVDALSHWEARYLPYMNDTSATTEERFAALIDALRAEPDVTQDWKGFGASGLKVKGKIFVMLSRGRLMVKLPRQRVDALVAAGEGERFDPRRNGQFMKEWLSLEPSSKLEWLPLAKEALAFVASKPS